ncbi:hypothetical protein SLS54_004434 [Diplodia seriata]
MLRGGIGQQWNGTYDLTFKHHTRTETLRRSREAGCSICIALANELRYNTDLLEDQDICIDASLSELKGGQWGDGGEYRLDFMLEKKRTRTFVLRPTGDADTQDFNLRTPRSYHTSSDEVFELAHNWISKCKCADSWNKVESKWYPTRLLDIQQLRSAKGVKIGEKFSFLSQNSDLQHTRIKLVEEDHATLSAKKFNRFVTLSHCWGRPRSVQGQLKLTSRTEEKFKTEGIELRSFTKSFRDAILFACRLEKVGYIWIDSICIKQPSSLPGDDPKDAEKDWLEQSRVMGDIYRNSFLNISATAALDGDKGLFFPRQPDHLWEDEINLNLAGLPGHRGGSKGYFSTGLNDGDGGAPKDMESQGDYLRRCTIIDVAFWENLVDNAPVNKRAWVLQERLMAPRVLHFCANQIAWECSETDRTEGHSEGVPRYKVKLGEIVKEGRLKSLDPNEDGLALREIRLKGFEDPDKRVENLYVYELWKRIVEVYSRTRLSMSRDKLIALSGIAKLIRDSHLKGVEYVAGMWNQHLESQLLWRVEPVFKDGIFENHATRDPTRAPSFSWAALDVPQGIVYGEATDYKDKNGNTDELLFKVKDFQLPHRDKTGDSYQFGLISNENNEGRIDVEVNYLRKIKLRRLELPRGVPYGWWLDEDASGGPFDPTGRREHTNVYLDAPDSDVDIFSETADLYCMPAAFGERTVKKTSRYLMCLLLQRLGNGQDFKRIGLTKLSNYADAKGQDELLAENERRKQTIHIR